MSNPSNVFEEKNSTLKEISQKLKRISISCDKNIAIQKETIALKQEAIESMTAQKQALYYVEFIINDGRFHDLTQAYRIENPDKVFDYVMMVVPYHMQNANANIQHFKRHLNMICCNIKEMMRERLN